MTQARQKASLQLRRTAEWVEQSPLWTHGGAMDEPCPERSLRFGRTKKIGEVVKKTKKKKMAAHTKGKVADQNKKLDRRREKKRDRKSYPLRGRAGTEGEGLSCHVILTRLEESQGASGQKSRKDSHCRHLSYKHKCRKGKKEGKSKHKSKSHNACIADYMHVLQPRKRRLASLNAEAVNSLLLERPWDTQPAAKQAKKQDEAATVEAAVEGETTAKTTAKTSSLGHSAKTSGSPKMCQSSKAKKIKAKVKANHFELLSRESLDAPAPRRLAGLNAAALLKLTSTSATAKQRVKNPPSTTTTTTATTTSTTTATTTATSSDCKTQPPATIKQHTRVKYKGRPPKHKGKKAKPSSPLGCSDCKDKSDFEPKVEWDTNSCTHRLTKPGYQSRSMLPYSLKQVKEEQMETELGPYYCCSPKGSVEYCHRLAFFLGQQPYSESNNQQLKSSLTPVKRECLVTSPSLTHSHPHTALTLSPHPCLCTADHCFSSYYVHIAHPPHTGATSPTMASRPLNFSPSSLCSGQMRESKLLDPRESHAGSGLPHPAYCNQVGAPCFGEACRMGGCAFRAMPPVTSRGCTFSAGCTGCTHSIKTESYSSPQGDHSPSLMVSSSLPMSNCPLSSVPTSTKTTKPQLLTPQPPARLKLAKECPQPAKTSTKTSSKSSSTTSTSSASSLPPKATNGSVSVGRTRLSQKQPPPAPALSSPKQKKVSRRRATNGWRPVGVPVEREVFIAGEEETALRQCYEGVERDGEVIHVRDTVLLRSGPRKKSLPYVAKISALWEDPKSGELMMSLFWYYRPEHTQGGRDPSAHCENEIFASRHQDENSVACIEDRCYVLPLAQYCRFCALMKRRAEGAPHSSGCLVPTRPDFAPPSHRCVPSDIDPDLVYLCRHVYDFRYGRILKNLQ